MIDKNENMAKVSAGYLFPEIAKRRRQFAAEHPEAKLISLSIGNTTEPLTPHIVAEMEQYVRQLGTKEGYSGYGDDSAGFQELREKIACVLYNGKISAEEVFVSDGAKCDVGRMQQLFGANVHPAIQDPAYPVYVDGSVMVGATGCFRQDISGYDGITYLPCLPENNFFPDLSAVQKHSLIYFCSPNNPTGAAASRAQLEELVSAALRTDSLIIFDAAYSAYIRDPDLPKSIFEIDGSRQCAVEINSFSKPVGFTGVRLGWSVVPRELSFSDGSSVADSWARLTNTFFNGASNIAQAGGLAALDKQGIAETRRLTDYYLENAKIICKALCGDNFRAAGVNVYGGKNAPYVWAQFPGKKSWELFDELLSQCHVITTPGSGFGAGGESCVRFSAFGHRENIIEAVKRLESFVIR